MRTEERRRQGGEQGERGVWDGITGGKGRRREEGRQVSDFKAKGKKREEATERWRGGRVAQEATAAQHPPRFMQPLLS